MEALDYRCIFIIDPIKGERIHLAKFIKGECYTVFAFTALEDCFKMMGQITVHLIIYVQRDKKSDFKKLENMKKKYREIPLIIGLSRDVPDIDLTELTEKGFTKAYKASTNEKIREITHELLSPDGLAKRTPTPHPIPFVNITLPTN